MRAGPSRRDCLVSLAGAMAMAPARAFQRADAYLFGSPVSLLLPQGTAAALRTAAMAGLAAMNARWNAWKPGDVSALNRAFRSGRSIHTTPSLVALIRGAARLESLSDGHFNAGIGGLVNAWGFHDDVLRPGPRPSAAALARWTASRPGLAQIEIRGLEVRSRQPALQLDFGAYAKGVAIDLTLDRLQREGVGDALLDLGGNLAAMGRPAGRPWIVGIRDPFSAGLVARLATRAREAVVTSGTYERWREVDGRRVSHILDPAFGVPASGLVSVTVVHASAGWADAAATALLVAGLERWPAVAARMGVDQVMVIDSLGRRSMTPTLARRLLPA